MIEVELASGRVDIRTNTPLILLRELGEPHRSLPIFIGSSEAQAIALGHQKVASSRPLTHDLLLDVIASYGGTLARVDVTELKDRNYFAELVIYTEGVKKVVSARPSDGVALAVRVGAPIFVNEDLLANEGVVISEGDFDGEGEEVEVDESDVIDDFRDFLNQVRPDDFS